MAIHWEALGGVLGGGGVVAFFNWLTERSKTRAYTMGAVDKAVDQALKSVTNELARVNKDIALLRIEHTNCQEQLDQGREERRLLDKKIIELEVELLMKTSKIADY